jgi:hypothetical protein
MSVGRTAQEVSLGMLSMHKFCAVSSCCLFAGAHGFKLQILLCMNLLYLYGNIFYVTVLPGSFLVLVSYSGIEKKCSLIVNVNSLSKSFRFLMTFVVHLI